MKPAEKTLIGVLLVAIFAAVGYQFYDWKSLTDKKVQEAREEEKSKWEQMVGGGEGDLAASSGESGAPAELDTAGLAEGLAGEEPLPDLFKSGLSTLAAPETISSENVAAWIDSFFMYLDQQEYITALNRNQSSKDRYNLLIAKVESQTPIASEMVLDFDAVIKNVIHFLRVLGKDDLMLAKQVLDNESEKLETILAMFHEYAVRRDPAQEGGIKVPSLPVRYEYATFFLNTLGGRSYLYRRDSRTRLLVTYYSVLTFHEANQMMFNQYGVDIMPYLDTLTAEIAVRNDLKMRDTYLQQLANLKGIYTAARTTAEQPDDVEQLEIGE